MLDIFRGKDRNPGAPKNQIEVVCPVCGAAQYEPRLVVTTFCRKCGEHLRIEKKKVIASSQINPVPSSIFPPMSEVVPPAPRKEPEPSSPADFRERKPTSEPAQEGVLGKLLIPAAKKEIPKAPELPPAPIGLGQMMGVEAEEEDESAGSSVLHTLQPRPAMPEAANEGAAAHGPIAASTLQKMKEQGYYRQQYFKDVDCFQCHNKFKVGRSAKSTNCPACGEYICLEDYDINLPSTTPILTRGDVFIRKNGNVSTSEIKCRELRVHGMIAANIDCSGDFILRTTGSIIGEIKCRKLVVEKGSDIQFVNTIHAEEVEINGRVSSNIFCNHQITIGSHGWINGDVTARSVSIEPGGQLDGAMNILRSTSAKPPAPKSEPLKEHTPELPLE